MKVSTNQLSSGRLVIEIACVREDFFGGVLRRGIEKEVEGGS